MLSQLAGIGRLSAPTILLLTFFVLASAANESLPITWLGVLIPPVWLVLSLVAWVAFALCRTTTVLITSGAALVCALGLLLVFLFGVPAA
ncbi:MAG: hypothetical protein Fur005_26870 [Roseiflexaceae bacterium]